MCIFQTIFSAQMSTFWTAVQAILVPAAVAVPIIYARHQDEQKKLKDIEAFRNLNFFVVRFLPQVEHLDFSNEHDFFKFKTTLDACLRLTKQIGLDRIHPSRLSVCFADIDVHASRILAYIELKDREQYRSELRACADQARHSLDQIDVYLRSKNVTLSFVR